ncbi:MAG: hypothetical protein M4D80_27730 [Myxococcota bacterium]|nr:hypothetical protein [Myxococcota bacterium]
MAKRRVSKAAKPRANKVAKPRARKARPRNPELEARLVAERDDPAVREVFADWLLSIGDPLGELLALVKRRANKSRHAAHRQPQRRDRRLQPDRAGMARSIRRHRPDPGPDVLACAGDVDQDLRPTVLKHAGKLAHLRGLYIDTTDATARPEVAAAFDTQIAPWQTMKASDPAD